MSIHLGVLPGHWNSAPQVDPQAPALKQGSGFMSHSHFNICAKDVDSECSLPRTTIAPGLFYIATSWTYGLINNYCTCTSKMFFLQAELAKKWSSVTANGTWTQVTIMLGYQFSGSSCDSVFVSCWTVQQCLPQGLS